LLKAVFASARDVKERTKPISAWDIVEKLDGKQTKVTVVKVTLEPGRRASRTATPAR